MPGKKADKGKARKEPSQAALVRLERLKTEGRSPAAIGERLELTRNILGVSQTEFAGTASIASNTYSQYKTGTATPNLENANRLCDQWQLTLDWIYRGDASGLQPDLQEAIARVRQARAPKP